MKNINNGKSNKEITKELMVCDVKKDLHIHTCYSDGELTPEQVVDRWISEGYELIAITDHDGIDGSIIGQDYAAGLGIEFIRGVEFDSEDELGKDLHILGYGIDYGNSKLQDSLHEMSLRRERRNNQLLEAINNLGYEITPDDIAKVNKGRYIGKPTFAEVMKKKGYIENYQYAFDTVFRHDSIRKVKKETFSTKEIIDLIHEADGVAVMAHPMEQRHRNESYEDFVPRLDEILSRMIYYGIDGIECFHPSANEEQARKLKKYADEHDLIVTRGSDFHSDKLRRDFSRYHRD